MRKLWVACTYLAASLGVFTSRHSTTDATDQGLPAAFAKQRAAARKLQGAACRSPSATLPISARAARNNFV